MRRDSRALWILALTLVALAGCLAPTIPEPPPEALVAPRLSQLHPSAPDGEPLPDNPSLQDDLIYAALHNPSLQASFHRWKAAAEKVPQMRALPDPTLSYEAMGQDRVQQQTFGVSQMLPWFGKLRLSGDIAAAEAEVAGQQFEAARLKLFYDVKDAYYEYYYLARAISVVQENRSLMSYFEEVLRTMYKVGAAENADLIRAQVELGKLDNELQTLQDLQQPMAARLNAVLNRPSDAAIPWPGKVKEEMTDATPEELLAWLRESNPDLAGLEKEVRGQEESIALSRKNYFPDVMVGLKYLKPMEMDMPGQNGIGLMLSVNVPIWWGKYQAAEREARQRHEAAVKEKADRENALSAEVRMVLYNLRDADRRVELYRDTLLPKARQSIKTTEAAFRAGTSSFLDLVDAERILLDFGLSCERAVADRAQRLAELEMLVGRELPRRAASGGQGQGSGAAESMEGVAHE